MRERRNRLRGREDEETGCAAKMRYGKEGTRKTKESGGVVEGKMKK